MINDYPPPNPSPGSHPRAGSLSIMLTCESWPGPLPKTKPLLSLLQACLSYWALLLLQMDLFSPVTIQVLDFSLLSNPIPNLNAMKMP